MDTLRILLRVSAAFMCLTLITTDASLAKEPSQESVSSKTKTTKKSTTPPQCEPNALFSTQIERRYKLAPQAHSETRRQRYILSEYISQRNVAAAGSVQLKSGQYAELDENNLLSTGSTESVSSFEISEDGSVYIGYVRDPNTFIEIPASPNLIVSAPAFAQSLIFEPTETYKVQEIALSPKEEKEAINTIRVESESAEEDVKICSGNIHILIFTSRPDHNSKSDKSMQINIKLEAQIN